MSRKKKKVDTSVDEINMMYVNDTLFIGSV